MVKIALAGGSGNVASEIIDVLVAEGKHDIVILTRKDVPASSNQDISYIKVDYSDKKQVLEALNGVHTVLSFMGEIEDPSSPVQRQLIDVSIEAGVKRFLPSEWAGKKLDHLPWYAYKGAVREYLAEVNKDKKVLEYTLFQPGFFLNYMSFPYKSSKYVHQIEPPFDFNKRRALLIEGSEDSLVSWTTVQDIVNVIVRAIDYEGEWPVDGGVVGSSLTLRELLAIGEKVRGGKPFAIEYIKSEDLSSGEWPASWLPKTDHPSIPPEQVDTMSVIVTGGILQAISVGAYDTSNSWNKLLPDYQFADAEEFLTKVWADKP